MTTDEKLRLELPALQLPSRKFLPPFESLRAFDAIAGTVDLMRGGDDRRLCIRCMPGLALH